MSLWSGIKAVFSGGGAVDVLKSASAGIDKLVFTDEEKADFSQKAAELWLEHQKLVVSESSVRSITRRYIALAFSGTFLLANILGVILWKWDPLWSDQFFGMADRLKFAASAIIIFYFGYYGVSKIVEKMKK